MKDTTTASPYRLLIVDDDRRILEFLEDESAESYPVLTAASGEDALPLCSTHSDIAVAIVDIRMPDMDGTEFCARARHMQPEMAVIFHTGYAGDYDEAAIESTFAPHDFIEKGGNLIRLKRSVEHAFELYSLRHPVPGDMAFDNEQHGLIGSTKVMMNLYARILQVSRLDEHVFICGEIGVGKDLVARAIHSLSSRRDGPFRRFNCAALTDTLAEAEFFGYRRGAFSGAEKDRIGLFQAADQGTLFLDEVADLSLGAQADLLHVVDGGEFRAVGASESSRVNVRIVSATNRNLDDAVARGSFKPDLRSRLEVLKIPIPPLRERREDIPALARHYLNKACDYYGLPRKCLHPESLALLTSYNWPENVRELINLTKRLVAEVTSDVILPGDVKTALDNDRVISTLGVSLADLTREYVKTVVLSTLAQTNGNLAAAARLLSVDPANFTKKVKELGIDISALRTH